MRIVNERLETILEYDLSKGILIPATAIKESAVPIDNITKFAWYDDDYEEAMMYIPNPETQSEPTPEERIAELEEALAMLLSGVTE